MRISGKIDKRQYMISFFVQDVAFKLKNQHRYKLWIRMLAKEHSRYLETINFIFCSDDYLLDLNRRFLGHDYCTDVISFDYSYLYTNKKVIGDIFLSIDTVQINAVAYGALSFEEELLRVMAHGLLHLFGYKDTTKHERCMMQEKEEAAIKLFDKI